MSAKPGADTAAEYLTEFFVIPRIQQIMDSNKIDSAKLATINTAVLDLPSQPAPPLFHWNSGGAGWQCSNQCYNHRLLPRPLPQRRQQPDPSSRSCSTAVVTVGAAVIRASAFRVALSSTRS